jgi:hypothetical protein
MVEGSVPLGCPKELNENVIAASVTPLGAGRT